eukprot:6329173-Pyramimonas_sp.AAC.1
MRSVIVTFPGKDEVWTRRSAPPTNTVLGGDSQEAGGKGQGMVYHRWSLIPRLARIQTQSHFHQLTLRLTRTQTLQPPGSLMIRRPRT